MPAKRKYKVRGTKDFIVLAGIFFFLCLWAIKDAWYPSAKVLEKHPFTIEAAFEIAGSMGSIHVSEGDSIAEGQLLAELHRTKMQREFEVAKNAYTAEKSKHTLADQALRELVVHAGASEEISMLKTAQVEAKAAMDGALKKVTSVRKQLDSTELHAPSKGAVQEIRVSLHEQVTAGQTVIVIDPQDHFYLFNKSLAIFSFIAFWVFLGIHTLAQ